MTTFRVPNLRRSSRKAKIASKWSLISYDDANLTVSVICRKTRKLAAKFEIRSEVLERESILHAGIPDVGKEFRFYEDSLEDISFYKTIFDYLHLKGFKGINRANAIPVFKLALRLKLRFSVPKILKLIFKACKPKDIFELFDFMLCNDTFEEYPELRKEKFLEVLSLCLGKVPEKSWCNASKSTVRELLTQDNVNATELYLLQCLIAWGKAEVIRLDLTDDDALRETIFEDLVEGIRFMSMPLDDFGIGWSSILQDNFALTEEEISSISNAISLDCAHKLPELFCPKRRWSRGHVIKLKCSCVFCVLVNHQLIDKASPNGTRTTQILAGCSNNNNTSSSSSHEQESPESPDSCSQSDD